MRIIPKFARTIGRNILLALALLLVLFFGLWLGRLPLAGFALERAAKARGLVVDVKVESLSTKGARLGDIVFGDELSIESAQFSWALAGLRRKEIISIDIIGAKFGAQRQNGQTKVAGFDLANLSPSGKTPWDIGAISIIDSQLALDIAPGRILADFDAQKLPDNGWAFTANAKPARLESKAWSALIDTIAFKGEYADNRLNADAEIEYRDAKWVAEKAGEFAIQNGRVFVKCDCDFQNPNQLAGKLEAQADFQNLNTPYLAAESAAISLQFDGATDPNDLLGALQAQMSISVQIGRAHAEPTPLKQAVSSQKMPEFVLPFANALVENLGTAASSFDVATDIKLNAQNGQFTLSTPTISMTSIAEPKSAVHIGSLQAAYAPKTKDWDFFGNAEAQLSGFGHLQLDALALRHDQIGALQLQMAEAQTAVQTGDQKLALQTRNISGQFASNATTLAGDIDAQWNGQIGGVNFTKARLKGPLQLVKSGSDWQGFVPGPSLSFAADRLRMGQWRASKALATLRPQKSRTGAKPLFTYDKDGFLLTANIASVAANVRKANVATLVVEIRGKDGNGTLRLKPNSTASATIDMARLSLDLPSKQSKYVRIGKFSAAAYAKNRRWRGNGRLGTVQYHSDGMPARVNGENTPYKFSFDKTGLDMWAKKLDLKVTSTDRPAIFPPLQLVLDTVLSHGGVTGIGEIRLARDGTYLSDLSLAHNLASARGTAIGGVERLALAPNGLELTELLPAFEGLVANAQGQPSGVFLAKWDATGLGETKGSVSLNGMNFDILLGRVENVTGEIRFSSLLPLTTKGSAEIQIGTLDPGMALNDGELVFALVEDGGLRIDRAEWPFAGGQLRVAPMLWKIGGLHQNVELQVENADLLELSGLFGFADLSAQGKLSGSIPAEITETSVLVRGGILRAPAPGILRYQSAVGDNAAGAAPQAKMAFDVLKNLHFNRLELRLDGDVGGRMEAGLVLEGNNPDVVFGIPFRLNITTSAEFSRLAAQASQGLRIGQNIQRMIENGGLQADE